MHGRLVMATNKTIKHMEYWIIIDSWNLMESFTTESLSPYSFYEQRSFGNDLTRHLTKQGELYNNLVLYSEEPISDYAIAIDSCIIDTSLLQKTKDKNAFLYPKTVYFRKPLVRFRFRNEKSITGFIAESKIIFEVKTVDKYSEYFYYGEGKITPNVRDTSQCLPFELQNYLRVDNLFNSIKGAMTAYACGQITSIGFENQNLLQSLSALKNAVAGLNTTIMMGEQCKLDDALYNNELAKTRTELAKSDFKSQTIQIEVLINILDEILTLGTQRLEMIARQKTPEYYSELETLSKKELQYRQLLEKMEDSKIGHLKRELQSIQSKEVENGKTTGKKRKLFPKGSKEYLRKQELKHQIDLYKNYNKEYRRICNEYKVLKSSLTNTVVGVTPYDSVLSSLFTRFSDNVNDMIKMVKTSKNTNERHDGCISPFISKQEDIYIKIPMVSREEEIVYNIILTQLLHHPIGKSTIISDSFILNLVKESGRRFSNDTESKSDTGKQIVSALRSFWLYRNQRADTFEIPDDMPLLQAIMSFFIKSMGFNHIERFMLNRGYQMKKYAYLLWGCAMGYAALPKTLTNILNGNPLQSIIDDRLASIYDEISHVEFQ